MCEINRILHCIIAVYLFILVSCSEKAKQRDRMEQQVAEWVGRQIHFPPKKVFMRYALDTITYDISEKEYGILIYTDSTGCTGCKLQPPRWQEMIALTDSVAPGKVSYLFFFSDAEVNYVRHLLKQAGVELPVSINDDNKLMDLNQFPEDTRFHTLLLDKDNRVVALNESLIFSSDLSIR